MKSKRTMATTPEARHLAPWCLSGVRTALTIGKAIRDRLKALQPYSPSVRRPECSTELHAMRIAAKHLRYTGHYSICASARVLTSETRHSVMCPGVAHR